MSEQECGGQAPDLWLLSAPELKRAIAELEAERDTLEARCRVVRRRIAILRAERLARRVRRTSIRAPWRRPCCGGCRSSRDA